MKEGYVHKAEPALDSLESGNDSEKRLADIDRQFNEREVYEFEGRENCELVEVIDIDASPDSLRNPLFVAPGYGEVASALKPNIIAYAEKDRRVISYNSISGVNHNHYQGAQDEASDITKRKLAIIDRIIKEKELQGIDAVGHSEGAVNVVFAALENPSRFRNIVLVNPAGLMGEDTAGGLLLRFVEHTLSTAKDIKSDEAKAQINQASVSERVQVTTKSPLRALKTLSALSQVRLEDILKELKDAGINISIIHSVDDVLFPMDRMQAMVKADMIDGFYSIEGSHNDYFLDPQSQSYVVNSALDALEEKRSASHTQIENISLTD